MDGKGEYQWAVKRLHIFCYADDTTLVAQNITKAKIISQTACDQSVLRPIDKNYDCKFKRKKKVRWKRLR